MEPQNNIVRRDLWREWPDDQHPADNANFKLNEVDEDQSSFDCIQGRRSTDSLGNRLLCSPPSLWRTHMQTATQTQTKQFSAAAVVTRKGNPQVWVHSFCLVFNLPALGLNCRLRNTEGMAGSAQSRALVWPHNVEDKGTSSFSTVKTRNTFQTLAAFCTETFELQILRNSADC